MADLRPVYVAGDGDVKGPATSSNGELPLFDGSTGKLLKGTGTVVTAQGRAIIDDATPAEQRNTIGLNLVDNTPDLSKPVSTPQQAALDLKANIDNSSIGDLSWSSAMLPPAGRLVANGALVSRSTYSALFAVITASFGCNTTSGNSVLTGVAAPSAMWVGQPISGPGIPSATVVAAVGANTVTMSKTATATASISAVVAPFGVGDGTTTFALPDMRGRVPRGWDGGAGLDPSRVFGSAQLDGNASHSHTATDSGHGHGTTDPGHRHSVYAGSATVALAGGGISYGVFSGSQNTDFSGSGVGVQIGTANINIASSGGTEARMKNLALLPCIKY